MIVFSRWPTRGQGVGADRAGSRRHAGSVAANPHAAALMRATLFEFKCPARKGTGFPAVDPARSVPSLPRHGVGRGVPPRPEPVLLPSAFGAVIRAFEMFEFANSVVDPGAILAKRV
jgi:hypothetical protein